MSATAKALLIRWVDLTLRLLLCLVVLFTAARADTVREADASDLPAYRMLPRPPYPTFARAAHEQGQVEITVRFDKAGKVEKCEVRNASTPKALTRYTCDFVKANWHSSRLAGKDMTVPIQYKIRDTSSEGLPAPPYPDFGYFFHLQGTILLAVTFAKDGSVERCQVRTTSASPALTKYTSGFIKDNWRSPEHAGETALVPIQYVDPHAASAYGPSLPFQ